LHKKIPGPFRAGDALPGQGGTAQTPQDPEPQDPELQPPPPTGLVEVMENPDR